MKKLFSVVAFLACSFSFADEVQWPKDVEQRVVFRTAYAREAVMSFNIKCEGKPNRYLPLINILRKQASENNGTYAVRIDVDSRDKDVRIYNSAVDLKTGKQVNEPELVLSLNSWGDLRMHGIRAEAIQRHCYWEKPGMWKESK